MGEYHDLNFHFISGKCYIISWLLNSILNLPLLHLASVQILCN